MSSFSACKHFGICGGCSTEQTSYQKQILIKQKNVEETFKRTCNPLIGTEVPWQYRNKMEYSFSQTKAGLRFLGLMMPASRGKVVTLEECLLTPVWFVEALQAVKTWWEKRSDLQAFFPPLNKGHLRTLTLREGKRTGEKMAVLTVAQMCDVSGLCEALLSVCPFDSIILRHQITAKKSPTRFEEHLLFGKDFICEKLWHEKSQKWLTFKLRSSSFFQPNTLMAEKIYNKAIELASLEPSHTVFDLYCGIGSIGLYASLLCKSVLGIELNAQAAEDAVVNAQINDCQNVRIIAGDVGKSLEETLPADVLFVDPPRAGLDPLALEKIARLRPKKIIYISCNPLTQSQNIEILSQSGYEICEIQPIDQFPHTPHVENIVALERLF